jgi:hypothetical protein
MIKDSLNKGKESMVTVIQIEQDGERSWFHKSTGQMRTIYRELTENGVGEEVHLQENLNVVEEIHAQTLKAIASSDTIAITNIEVWNRIYERLQSGSHRKVLDARADERIIVPWTKVREFRYAFKGFPLDIKRAIAAALVAHPHLLQNFWNNSVESLGGYQNDAAFYPTGRQSLPVPPITTADIRATRQAQAFIKANGIILGPGPGGISFNYIDHEISPLATRGGIFGNGMPATRTGRGGVDLLLNCNDRLCIAEIKIANDSELFDALIQALWYASEFATPNQLQRCMNALKLNNIDQQQVDIAVISIGQNNDVTRPHAIAFAAHVNENPGAFAGLGKIWLIENDGVEWHIIE